MGVWRKVEETVWLGKVMQDYGVISDEMPHRKVSVLLAGKHHPALFLKESWSGFLAKSVRYTEMDRQTLERLDAAIHDALRRM